LRSTTYYPALDGLRGLAALMVVYGDMGYVGWVPLVVGCASIGVVLFFFLSSFLMGHHYMPGASRGMPDKKDLRYWGAFLSRRLMRVYPLTSLLRCSVTCS
jgi:peptidoglycan/LPS O-acetylase OafA/YrhL